MSTASPYEKRLSPRTRYEERGFLNLEGNPPMPVRLFDVCPKGVGAFCRKPAPVGVRAVLSVKLQHDLKAAPYDAEVRWCAAHEDAAHNFYPFRLGLSLINGAGQARIRQAPRQAPVPKPVESNYRVKGSMIIDFAKMIRRHHDRPWQDYVSLDDMGIISGMIIPAKWYPLDVFRRTGVAVLSVFGQDRDESARQWGRGLVTRIPPELYRSFFDKDDPKAAIKNYVNVNMRVFDFLRVKFNDQGDKEVLISLNGADEVKNKFPELGLLGLMLGGALEELASKNGARNVRTRVDESGREDQLLGIGVDWS